MWVHGFHRPNLWVADVKYSVERLHVLQCDTACKTILNASFRCDTKKCTNMFTMVSKLRSGENCTHFSVCFSYRVEKKRAYTYWKNVHFFFKTQRKRASKTKKVNWKRLWPVQWGRRVFECPSPTEPNWTPQPLSLCSDAPDSASPV